MSQSHHLFIGILMALFTFTYNTHTRTPHFYLLFPVACLSLMAMLAVKRWRNRNSVNNFLSLYGIILVSLASWMQYYPVTDIRHCYGASTPMIGLFSYGAWQLCSFKKKNIQILMVCLILVSVFGFEIRIRISSGLKRITAVRTKIEEPKVLRGMYAPIGDAITYKTISRYLNDAIGRNSLPYLVNMTSDPLYLTFLGPQKNFHPLQVSNILWDKNIYPDFRKRVSDFIDTKHPLILWYDGKNIPGWTRVKVFSMLDEGYYLWGNNYYRLALYRFTSNHDAM